MANYKTIHGTTIKSYTTDPDNPIEGQVWYDKTNKVLQFQIPNLSTGAWRTGNSLGTARYYQGSAGLYTSGIVFGGECTGFEGKAPSQFEKVLNNIQKGNKTIFKENFDEEAQKEFIKGTKIAFETIINDGLQSLKMYS